MPTYRNVHSAKREFNGKVVEPGQEVCSLAYYNEKEIQLIKVSDKPFYNPVVSSGPITEKGVLKIPVKDNLGVPIVKYAIHFYVEHGCVDIRFNSPDNEPCLNLYEEAKWNMRCFERNVDTIHFNSDKSFKIWVIIEKL
jgi:hypothetical protein